MNAAPEEMQLGQAETMSVPKRWPLVTRPGNRSTSFLKDARLVNCYAEKTEQGFQVEKRFGLNYVDYTLSPGLGQGMTRFDLGPTALSTIFVSNDTVYQLQLLRGVPQLIPFSGGITTSQGFGILGLGMVRFQFVAAPNPYLIFGSGNGAPTYYLGGGTSGIQTITDVNFPNLAAVPGYAVLDGTTYVMDSSSNIWGSAGLNNPTVWDALNVIQANSESDTPIMLTKQLVYVIALKSTSVQIFYDAGNATGSPLAPLPGALIKYGCLDANTVQDIDGRLLWVTNDKNNVSQVGMMENLQFRIISNPAIDRFLNLTTQTVPYVQSFTFRSWSVKFAGHRFYGITNVTANISLVYDIDQDLWYQWTDSSGNMYRTVAIATDLENKLIAQDYSSGAVSFIGPDYACPNDNGTLFPMDIYTPNFDAGVDREKTLSTLYFEADKVPADLLVRFSDDDYQTWNNFRSVNLNNKHPQLCDEGSFYRRAYHFRHQANTPLRIRAVGFEMDIGTL